MRRTALATAAGVVLVLLAAAQFVLPAIAAQRLRDRLAASGKVLQVEVDAFPAIELLWHHADRVVVRMSQYRSDPGDLGGLLHEAADVGSLDASVAELDVGQLTLRNVSLRAHASTLTATARVTEADLRAALPVVQSVQPAASAAGQLTLRGTAAVLGTRGGLDATVRAQNGQLVLQPDVPFGGFAKITIFRNPKLEVDSVGANAAPGGFSVSANGRLR